MRATFHLGFALVYLCLPGDLVGQVAARIRAMTFGQLIEVDGITVCAGTKVRSYIALDMLGYTKEIRAHEEAHQQQRDRFESCDAWLDNYDTPLGMLESEAEAYGVAYCAIRGGPDPIGKFQDYVRAMERRLGGEVNRLTVVTALHRFTKNCAYPGMP